ncbi:MAG: radical SAM protein [Desulfosarcina sp.]|nr:radical SAM protein [Desulfobacterales bacterium]
MKKIVLIQPQTPENFWTLHSFLHLMNKKGNIPPISLATVAALTPEGYQVEIIDENIQPLDFEIDCDLVGITGYTVHAPRMFEIAAEFRKRGVLTVGGGVYCASHLEECRPHFDIVVAGEAENTWAQVLVDLERGEYRECYVEPEFIDIRTTPVPRWELLPVEQYLSGIVQASRGCPNDCEFCDVTALFGRQCRYKQVDQVIEETQWFIDHGAIEVFFADDNFIGNKRKAKAILKRLVALKNKNRRPVAFVTQVTLTVAEDEELLRLFREAGFIALFIGIETPKKESLEIANKQINLRMDLKAAVRRIQSHGIMVYSGLVVGFDTDDLDIFEQQERFLREAGIIVPMIGMLVAAKNTRLWKRLEQENRLVPDREYGDQERTTNMVPLLMTREELQTHYFELIRKVHGDDHFWMRYQAFIGQIDLDKIYPDSILASYMALKNFQFDLMLWTLRVVAIYIFASEKRHRQLFFKVMGRTLTKSIKCLPLALNALAYFKSLDVYVKRNF